MGEKCFYFVVVLLLEIPINWILIKEFNCTYMYMYMYMYMYSLYMYIIRCLLLYLPHQIKKYKRLRKPKTNFRSSIKKLREQNTALELHLSALTNEKEVLLEDLEKEKQQVKDHEAAISEKEKQSSALRSDLKAVKDKLSRLEKNRGDLSVKLDQSKISCIQLKKQLGKTEREKQSLEQRVEEAREASDALSQKDADTAKDIQILTENFRKLCPNHEETRTKDPIVSSPQLSSLCSLHSSSPTS